MKYSLRYPRAHFTSRQNQRNCNKRTGFLSKMNGQTVLTRYFTASKSHQSSHPAKRRKVEAGIDVLSSKSAKFEEKCSSLSEEKLAVDGARVSRPMASGKARQTRSSRARNLKKSRNVSQGKVVSEGVVSVATSAKDDHESRKPRKQCQAIGDDFPTVEPITAPAEEKASQPEPQIEDPATQTHGETNADPKPANIPSQSRTGHKINPWIAEQAKLVLSSRGKQALEKSLAKKTAAGDLSKVAVDKPRIFMNEKRKVEQSYTSRARSNVHVPRLSEGVSTVTPKSTSEPGESTPTIPAYKRFSHLLEAKKPKPADGTKNLPLPYHFKVLEEMFRCVDVVLSLKQKRYETCTFEKLKDAVQEMCRKKFEKKHLSQMKTVCPDAFVFHQRNYPSGSTKTGYQLTIDFNFKEQQDQKAKQFKCIESSILISRQKQFKHELLKITMGHHHKYLANNYPSLTVDDDAIMRWHPCFPLDEVPEIGQSPLPEPPQVKTYSTAQDVLDKARQNLTTRVEKALILAANKAERNNIKSTTVNIVSNSKDSIHKSNQNPSLNGVSQSLIDKIRLKEERKIEEALTVNSDVQRKRVMLQRLPELCRILKSYFVSERKAAIPLEDVNNKLAESYTSTLSSVQVEKHVRLLSEVAPEWLSIMYVRKCPYVKVKKNVNIKSLIEKLKSKEIN